MREMVLECSCVVAILGIRKGSKWRGCIIEVFLVGYAWNFLLLSYSWKSFTIQRLLITSSISFLFWFNWKRWWLCMLLVWGGCKCFECPSATTKFLIGPNILGLYPSIKITPKWDWLWSRELKFDNSQNYL